jgi:hypothetical protein
MGSGLLIKKAIHKYGLENFEKRILLFFENDTAMFAEIVNSEFLLRENVYNIVEGGQGRFPPDATWKALASKTPAKLKEISQKGREARIQKYGKSLAPASEGWTQSEANRKRMKELWKAAVTPEALAKRKATCETIGHQKGEKNSQFGTMWITTGVENKKIKKDEPIPEGWVKGYHPKNK